ncbi:T9SS type A sorting domain-containing protein [Flammeovirga yaeyamensis]|uniref:T9SS type A sorting domain-containing protein n=1 Tax=Flammeovirga yaeyamensis TaxID=367791 RepID=A0AAX1NCN2_9BACT|nr:T9SS type A sorting domain-containing protein [Flammeovirga yaeyamensis]MBB3696848.1 phospholipid N-methyltransferase [Flammeovirga yaeyamensis]NMF33514.1 T9SS type A sorting domain-containing protein [Flammeovirga yaeyamensis]QWG05215.1 T9SS type A sorting domain-containing protein [Flammeovirga yaeyamensis]
MKGIIITSPGLESWIYIPKGINYTLGTKFTAFWIKNTTGITLQSGKLDGQQIINVIDLPQGLYLLKLQSEEGIITKKFFKN